MKDAYARYMISIGPKPGCGLTEKGYEALAEALDSELANALDEALEAFSVALPKDVDDAVQMKWQEVPTAETFNAQGASGKLPCGCLLFAGLGAGPGRVEWCSLHAVAPQLLAALEAVVDDLDDSAVNVADLRKDHGQFIRTVVRVAKGVTSPPPPTMLGQPISWDDAKRISKDGP